jgi:hypothetical protein
MLMDIPSFDKMSLHGPNDSGPEGTVPVMQIRRRRMTLSKGAALV